MGAADCDHVTLTSVFFVFQKTRQQSLGQGDLSQVVDVEKRLIDLQFGRIDFSSIRQSRVVDEDVDAVAKGRGDDGGGGRDRGQVRQIQLGDLRRVTVEKGKLISLRRSYQTVGDLLVGVER